MAVVDIGLARRLAPARDYRFGEIPVVKLVEAVRTTLRRRRTGRLSGSE